QKLLRSSPDANVGCSTPCRWWIVSRRPVAILTRRERRVQPAAAVPEPADSGRVAILTRRERRVQLRRCRPRSATGQVAILTRRERRVQQRYELASWTGLSSTRLRSSPDANVGCSRRRLHGPDLRG